MRLFKYDLLIMNIRLNRLDARQRLTRRQCESLLGNYSLKFLCLQASSGDKAVDMLVV